MSESAPVIERVEAPSRADFHRDWVEPNKPVILTGVADRWPAMKWTPESLREAAGDAPVTVHYDEDGDFCRWYLSPTTRQDKKMTLGEFLDIVSKDPPDLRYYMTEHAVRKIDARLQDDVDFSRYIDDANVQLFLGRHTAMPLHFHGVTEALLCQLHGSKEITLYPPSEFGKLYAGPWYGHSPLFSRVDARKPDLERFPRFAEAKPMTFALEPGEILFIPVHWWHFTRVKEGAWSLSVTSLWRAKLSCYTFPSPGLQTCARDVLRFVRTGIGKVLPLQRAS